MSGKRRLDLGRPQWSGAGMSKHVAGLIGLLVGIVVLVIMGIIWNEMLKSIPYSKPKPPPTEVSVGVIPEPAPAKNP
jgi:hypothetical protein